MLLYVAVQLWILLPQSGLAQSDSVDQSPPEVRVSEGQSVTLHCNFTTLDTSPYLFWYRQYPNQPPQHILTKSKFDAPDQTLVQGKFSASLYMGNRTVPFQIEAVSHQESAVYYCALRPTVGENCTSARTISEQGAVYRTMIESYKHGAGRDLERRSSPAPCDEAGPNVHGSSLTGAVLGDSVQPREPQMSGAEGGSVTLSCSYETSYTAGVYLFWYRQYPNRAPQYILRRGAKGSTFSDTAGFAQERFSSQAADSSTGLNITALELADTAVYLCALQRAQ